jgi:hypothetical protein
MTLSSLILSIGFSVMMFSQFLPTMQFGLLSSLMMLWALMGDILLLPAMVMVISAKIGIKPSKPAHGRLPPGKKV